MTDSPDKYTEEYVAVQCQNIAYDYQTNDLDRAYATTLNLLNYIHQQQLLARELTGYMEGARKIELDKDLTPPGTYRRMASPVPLSPGNRRGSLGTEVAQNSPPRLTAFHSPGSIRRPRPASRVGKDFRSPRLFGKSESFSDLRVLVPSLSLQRPSPENSQMEKNHCSRCDIKFSGKWYEQEPGVWWCDQCEERKIEEKMNEMMPVPSGKSASS